MANIRTEDKKWPGMKKQPKSGYPKGKYKKPFKPVTYGGKLKYGLSEYQKRTNADFMKVRDGETIEQWKKRTIHRRVREIDEIKELSRTNKLRVILRSRERNTVESKNKYLVVQPVVREFDFLRYYGVVINYYSIKHDVRVEDFQLGFYFYTNIPFTQERFENAAVLHLGTSKGKLNYFINKGYLEEVIHLQKHYNREDTKEKTHLYKLTNDFVKLLTNIYRTLGKMNKIRLTQPIFTGLSGEIKQIIMEMNDEIQEIQTGNKPQEKIVTNK